MHVEKVLPFFTPLWVCNIGNDFASEIAACYQMQDSLPTVSLSNIGGYQSPNVRLEDSFPSLLKRLSPILESIASDAELVVGISNAWVNINKTHNSNKPHIHPQAALSGVVYLQVEADTGELVFENPTNSTAFPVDDSVSHFYGVYHFTPKVGDVVLFPAYLRHYVTANNATTDRISIAFNMV